MGQGEGEGEEAAKITRVPDGGSSLEMVIRRVKNRDFLWAVSVDNFLSAYTMDYHLCFVAYYFLLLVIVFSSLHRF